MLCPCIYFCLISPGNETERETMARKKLARENSPMIDIPGPSPANAQSPERENANSAVRESGIPLAVPAPPHC